MSDLKRKVIVIGDLRHTAVDILKILRSTNLIVDYFVNAEEALIEINNGDLVVIVWNDNDFDGLNWLKKIKTSFLDSVLTVICTTRKLEFEIMTAFHAGADDVFRLEHGGNELLARVGVLLRRFNFDGKEKKDARVLVDLKALYLGVGEDRFTKLETVLFRFFLMHIDKCVTIEEIVPKVWAVDSLNPKVVIVAVNRLRKKVETIFAGQYRLVNIYGAGYKLIQLNSELDELVS